MAKVPAKVVKLKAPNRKVYITIPAAIAGDYDKISGITKKVLGKLGCTPCHSGFDLRFKIEGDDMFRFDEKLNVIQGLGR